MSDSDELQELVDDFVAESREHLATVEADLLRLEQGDRDADVVNNIFRCVHSVKGVAGFLGLGTIQELAHNLESTLDLVRKQRLESSGELTSVLLTAIDALSQLIEDVDESNEADIRKHLDALSAIQEEAQQEPSATEDTPESAPAAASEAPAVPSEASPEPAAPKVSEKQDPPPAQRKRRQAETIRVGVDLLNRLMNLSGELVLGRNQVVRGLNRDADRSMHNAVANLSQVVSEMQEAIMQTRLQPVATLFQKLPRIVRDLADRLGKRCCLVQEGGEVELDRSILEALADPMTHLVRNALDHGIESPERRRRAGKSTDGCVKIKAFHQGGNVRIEIEDDGAGIDPDRLRQRAVQKRLLTEEQAAAMPDREARLLIFAAGFSTAEQLSEISGRGVGMDVVRSNIERLGGSIDIDSETNKGTTLSITIPLTLAIMPALVVSCGGQSYVVPQSNVTELVRLNDDDAKHRIVTVNERRSLRLRGRLLPVASLVDVLGLEVSGDRRAVNVMVVQSGACEFGLIIDEPPDTEEIVVKPLGRHLRNQEEFSGATILGDGHVGLILDIAGISNAHDLRAHDNDAHEVNCGDEAKKSNGEADLAIFRAGSNDYYAVPLGIVARIQRATHDELVSIGDKLVYRANDEIMPVVQIPGSKPVDRGPDAPSTLLVLRLGDRHYAAMTEAVEEIRSEQVRVDDETLREHGVIGSLETEQGTVRLLDTVVLGSLAYPELGQEQGQHRAQLRVLLAEDSGFFRQHVSRVLAGEGFAVTAARDGEEAWLQLEGDSGSFDLVVTDVQMPNCDGLELTRRIRASERHRDLPVLALSSLSRQEDQDAGIEAGVTEYLVKLDDSTLMAAIHRHCGATR